MALKKWTNEGLGLVESLDVELAGPDEPDEKRVAALVGGQVAVCELMMSEHAGDMAAREDVIARITEMDPDVVSREVGTTTAHERNLFDAVRQRALSDSRLSASMLSRTGELLSRHGPEMIGASQWDALASSQSRAVASHAALQRKSYRVVDVARSTTELAAARAKEPPEGLIVSGTDHLMPSGALGDAEVGRRLRDLASAASWRECAQAGSREVFNDAAAAALSDPEASEHMLASGVDDDLLERMRERPHSLSPDEKRAAVSALMAVDPDGSRHPGAHPAVITHPQPDGGLPIESTSLDEVDGLIDRVESMDSDADPKARRAALMGLHRLTVLINRRAGELDRFWRTGRQNADLAYITPSGGEIDLTEAASSTDAGGRMAEATYPSKEVATRHARVFADRVVDEAADSQAMRELAERIGEGLSDHEMQSALKNPGGILHRGREATTTWRTAVVPNVPVSAQESLREYGTEKELDSYSDQMEKEAQAGDTAAETQLDQLDGEPTRIERLPVETTGGKRMTAVTKPARKRDDKGRQGPQLGG